jgi:hypothetical protein
VSSDPEKERLAKYVQLWAENAPALERLRDEDVRRADTASSIRMFDLAFRIALRDLPPRPSSGLVAWQDFVSRWRKND